MKFLRYLGINIALLLTSFGCIFAMEQDIKPAPKIPEGVFRELTKAGITINENAKTEKEIFAIADKFMKAGGGAAKSVLNLVKETGLKKGFKDYTYGDFKADIMDDIIDVRARLEAWKKVIEEHPTYNDENFKAVFSKYPETKLMLLKQLGYPKNKFSIAAKAEAYNWAKHQLKYDNEFKEELQDLFVRTFFDTQNIDLKALEVLLKFGANPDAYEIGNTKLDFITSWRIVNPRGHEYSDDSKQLEILELLLKYGANPNIKSNGLSLGRNIHRNSGMYPNYPLHRVLLWKEVSLNNDIRNEVFQDRLDVVKLLLKYGANPNLKDPSGAKPIDYAKSLLKYLQGTVGYYSGLGKEDEKTKIVKQIIKLLEEEMAKPDKKRAQEKEENPHIGMYMME